ncbi:hypothetical protein C8J57DRAFT_534151 [Mycena rebaudengoi]|nr:hypothetical protein C8J57DRAFT_534151 [Mycena rebaudengoi]
MPDLWKQRIDEISKDWYTTDQPLPGQWECAWEEWGGLLFMFGTSDFTNSTRVEEYINHRFGITGRIEPLAFIPETRDYFMFTADGQYYEFVDFDAYRFDRLFASHDEFVQSIQPMDLRRAASTKLQRLPEFDSDEERGEDDDEFIESDADEDFDSDDEFGTSPRSKL